MGLVNLTLYNDITNRDLIKSPTCSDRYVLPTFYKGDTLPIVYNAYYQTINNYTETYTIISVDDYSNVKIGLYSAANSTLLSGVLLTKNQTEGYYYGILPLNTQAIQDALKSTNKITAVFEIEITDNSGNIITTYQSNCTIARDYITNDINTIPAPTAEYAEKFWVLSAFVKKHPDIYEPISMISPNGSRFLIWINDNGEITTQKIG